MANRQIAITLLPTSAQERRLNSIFSDDRKRLLPPAIHDEWRKDQPLLLDLAKQLRLTSFTFDFLLTGLLLEQLPIVCQLMARVRSNVDLRDLRNVQMPPISAIAATPRWWQSSHSGDIADQPPDN